MNNGYTDIPDLMDVSGVTNINILFHEERKSWELQIPDIRLTVIANTFQNVVNTAYDLISELNNESSDDLENA